MTFTDMRAQARAVLKGNWGTAALAMLVLNVILGVGTMIAMIPILGMIAMFFIQGPVMFGMYHYCKQVKRNGKAELEEGLFGFKYILKTTGLMALMTVLIFLWSLLLFVPGIIAAFKYSQAFFILSDDPEKGIRQCLDESKEMMKGNKMRFFLLSLTFFGWCILAAFTFGVGYLFLGPYMYVTYTIFYDEISGNAVSGQPTVTL